MYVKLFTINNYSPIGKYIVPLGTDTEGNNWFNINPTRECHFQK